MGPEVGADNSSALGAAGQEERGKKVTGCEWRRWLRESGVRKQWGKKLLELWFRHVNAGLEDGFPQQRNSNCPCRQGPYFSRSPSGNWGNWTSVWKGCFSLQKGSICCSVVFNSCDPMAFNPLAPLSMGFSRQEYWSELPFSSPGESFDPGIERRSLVLAGGFFTIWATREALHTLLQIKVDPETH